MRKTLRDVRLSTIPQALGFCQGSADGIPGQLLAWVNEAQEKLWLAGGELGWWGTWWKTAFAIASDSTITVPANVARIINLEVCHETVKIQNEFYEFLEAGVGLQPPYTCQSQCVPLQTYDRGLVPTYADLPATSTLRVYISDARDVGKRILLQGTDTNGRKIRSVDGRSDVEGSFLAFAQPFTETSFTYATLYGVQKDLTYGDVLLYAVDPTTGALTRLALYEPSESNPQYRRYYLGGLPACCNGQKPTSVMGMAKLDFRPARVDTDWMVIGNLPALKEECLSIKYSEMDELKAMSKSLKHHENALQYLNKELDTYLGRERPAIGTAPDGTAVFENRGIGTLM